MDRKYGLWKMRSIENEKLVENTECGKWEWGGKKNKKKNYIKNV